MEKATKTVLSDEDTDYSITHDAVRKGSLVAIFTDDPGEDYYLLKAIDESEILDRNETDSWGSAFRKENEIIRGLYYKRKPNQVLQYQIIPKKMTIVSVNSILCTLPINANNAITISLSTHEDLVGLVGECTI
ncbi:MAG: hypothetical protein ABW185_29480 [Sedimenticola sp.]